MPPRIYIAGSTVPATITRTCSRLPPTSVTGRNRLARPPSTIAATTAIPAAIPAESGVTCSSLMAGTIVSAITTASRNSTVALSRLIGCVARLGRAQLAVLSDQSLNASARREQQLGVAGGDDRTGDQHHSAGRCRRIGLTGDEPGQRTADLAGRFVCQPDSYLDRVIEALGHVDPVRAEHRSRVFAKFGSCHRPRR